MAYQESWIESFKQMNIMTALALAMFTVTGLVMTELAQLVIDYLTTYRFLPFGVTMMSAAMIFASSGTRDARHYHPVEWAVVGMTGVLVVGNAFLVEVQDVITNNEPWGAIIVMVLMVVAAAILAR